MNTHEARQMLATFIVALGVCLGGYLLLARPLRQRLAVADARARQVRGQLADQQRALESAPIVQRRFDDAKAHAARIAALSADAADQAALFASLDRIAATHGVVVERVDPISTRSPDRKAASGAPAEPDGDAAFTVETTVRAAYPDLVAFVADVQHAMGFARVTMVRVMPVTDAPAPIVTATIRSTHFAFKAPTVVADAAATGQEAAP